MTRIYRKLVDWLFPEWSVQDKSHNILKIGCSIDCCTDQKLNLNERQDLNTKEYDILYSLKNYLITQFNYFFRSKKNHIF